MNVSFISNLLANQSKTNLVLYHSVMAYTSVAVFRCSNLSCISYILGPYYVTIYGMIRLYILLCFVILQHSAPPVSLHGQLIFREFFYTVAYDTPNFDRMVGNPLCKQIPWSDDEAKLLAWKQVCTTVLYCYVSNYPVLQAYCHVLFCTVMYCSVLIYTVLFCTVLHCTVLLCSMHDAYCNRASRIVSHNALFWYFWADSVSERKMMIAQ